MARNEDSGKSKGFRFLKYEDQRWHSTVLVDDDSKRDFPNLESEDEIAKYNPRNDRINNSTFNSVRNQNEEAQVETDRGNDNDQIEDHEEEDEDEEEGPMAEFSENKETTMSKKRTTDDQKSYKLNRNAGSKSHRRSHRHHHHHHHHKHSRNRNDKQSKTSGSYSQK
ncbi:hypothetical protein B5S33_g5329 [[Candida] boidinii]|nr:hypothetical protein B5S30_g2077 [[Candida] boidinii]OWB86624.1 hypothetical protein B5S33_g5329 [[Candida] boidinii]